MIILFYSFLNVQGAFCLIFYNTVFHNDMQAVPLCYTKCTQNKTKYDLY